MIKMSLVKIVLILETTLSLEAEEIKVKMNFLYGNFENKIYMKEHDGFLVEGKINFMCRLRNSLYGLIPAPMQWYKKFEYVMCDQIQDD